MRETKQARPGSKSRSRWATEEYGEAELGNSLRTERLVAMAGAALRKPGGLITEVFAGADEREGAYKFLENSKVSVSAISAAACRAAATRAKGMPYVFVPEDGSSLSLREYEGDAERGLGSVGARKKRGTGLQVMNAIVIDPKGVPLGLFDQRWWIRSFTQNRVHPFKRKLEDKETRYWIAGMNAGIAEWTKVNPDTKLWFQLDRGADFREMLSLATTCPHWVTVRAAYDRRTMDEQGQEAEQKKYLWQTVEAEPVATTVTVKLPKAKNRADRSAKVELRYAKVTLRLLDKWGKTTEPATLWALLAREKGKPGDGSEPLEWLLLTNHEIGSAADAELVLFGYTQRWRVEQFHKTWKSVCHIEDTQLRDASHIERWATVLASVAMRLLRLTYFARIHPNMSATVELSEMEVRGLIVEKGWRTHKLGDTLSIELATRWIAELGGYVGKSSGGPPGTIVLSRGLRRLADSVETLWKVLEYTR